MIGIYNKKFNDIPALIVVDSAKEKEALPAVVYAHGFTSAKEHNLPFAYLLAEKGFRVVLPDSKYHGAREVPMSSLERQISFWDIVMTNVVELKQIKEQLEKDNLLLDGRFGMAGTSMGGITTAAALTQYPWIKTAAILMGTPKLMDYAQTLIDNFRKMGNLPVTDQEIEAILNQLKKYDLSAQIDKLEQRPLLFWHGDSDSVVPFDHAFSFYNKAKEYYENSADLVFLKEKDRNHKVSRYAILETVKWFEMQL